MKSVLTGNDPFSLTLNTLILLRFSLTSSAPPPYAPRITTEGNRTMEAYCHRTGGGPGNVYLCSTRDYAGAPVVKIGYTRQEPPELRMGQLDRHLPDVRLFTLFHCADPVAIEQKAHRRLAPFRADGASSEMFAVSPLMAREVVRGAILDSGETIERLPMRILWGRRPRVAA